jgi:hypothetical protein
MVDLIEASLPNAEIIRIHVAGDFKTLTYFDAWCQVARNNPHMTFYAYTKSLPFWVRRMDTIPSNFVLTASRGGLRDDLISLHDLPEAVVVHNAQEAAELGLDVDSNDFHAYDASNRKSFALIVHGVQPKGTTWAKSIQEQKTAARRELALA